MQLTLHDPLTQLGLGPKKVEFFSRISMALSNIRMLEELLVGFFTKSSAPNGIPDHERILL